MIDGRPKRQDFQENFVNNQINNIKQNKIENICNDIREIDVQEVQSRDHTTKGLKNLMAYLTFCSKIYPKKQ